MNYSNFQLIEQLADEFFGSQTVTEIEPLPVSGSARKYYRLTNRNQNLIAVFNDDVKENEAFFEFSSHFLSNGASVPQIFRIHPSKKAYLLQDLGDITLFNTLQAIRYSDDFFPGKIIDLYKNILTKLVQLQTKIAQNLDYNFAYPRADFDEQAMRWDLNYFKYNFLKLAHIDFNEQLLETDFDKLIKMALEQDSHFFMFRDFQSRNIMLFNNEVYFIDYQGGRRGALAYDLASLLLDAKAKIPFRVRLELVAFYFNRAKEFIQKPLADFQTDFFVFALIRQLQAMGAYGYRGLFEQKLHFIESIPPAQENIAWLLQNLTPLKNEMPHLFDVLTDISQSDYLKNIAQKRLKVSISSFSFRKGIPQDANGNGGGFVFDCRFIHNPGRYEQYKMLTGLDQPVIDFLDNEQEMTDFLTDVYSLVGRALKKYRTRNFQHLMVNFGCTGGRHRSVYAAERLKLFLLQNFNVDIELTHTEKNAWCSTY